MRLSTDLPGNDGIGGVSVRPMNTNSADIAGFSCVPLLYK